MRSTTHRSGSRSARQRAHPFFTRAELQRLLSLYSRRVSEGVWRDYAIDQRGNVVVFSVFRHTREQPMFALVKHVQAQTYEVYHGPKRVKRAASLGDALADLDRRSGMTVVR